MKMWTSLGLIIYPSVLGMHGIKPYVLVLSLKKLFAISNSIWFHPSYHEYWWEKGHSGVVAHTYNSSIWKVGARGWWIGGLPQFHSESLFRKSREGMVFAISCQAWAQPGVLGAVCLEISRWPCVLAETKVFFISLARKKSIGFSHQTPLPGCCLRKSQKKERDTPPMTDRGNPSAQQQDLQENTVTLCCRKGSLGPFCARHVWEKQGQITYHIAAQGQRGEMVLHFIHRKNFWVPILIFFSATIFFKSTNQHIWSNPEPGTDPKDVYV